MLTIWPITEKNCQPLVQGDICRELKGRDGGRSISSTGLPWVCWVCYPWTVQVFAPIFRHFIHARGKGHLLSCGMPYTSMWRRTQRVTGIQKACLLASPRAIERKNPPVHLLDTCSLGCTFSSNRPTGFADLRQEPITVLLTHSPCILTFYFPDPTNSVTSEIRIHKFKF